MVEFAFVGPLLLTLLFGVIEFSWTFNQVLDSRHGAREGARLAAVNYTPSGAIGDAQTAIIVATICNRVDVPAETRITLSLPSGARTPGSTATIRVERDLDQLTGFFDQFLRNVEPNGEATFILEQNVTWNAVTDATCP